MGNIKVPMAELDTVIEFVQRRADELADEAQRRVKEAIAAARDAATSMATIAHHDLVSLLSGSVMALTTTFEQKKEPEMLDPYRRSFRDVASGMVELKWGRDASDITLRDDISGRVGRYDPLSDEPSTRLQPGTYRVLLFIVPVEMEKKPHVLASRQKIPHKFKPVVHGAIDCGVDIALPSEAYPHYCGQLESEHES